MGWLDQAFQTAQTIEQKIRMAGQNPVVKAILNVEAQLNPLTRSTQLAKQIVRKVLSPEDAQRVEHFESGINAGLFANILDAGAVGATEDQELQKAKAQYLQRANAEVAAKTNLGTTSPPPAAGNRVDAATPQIGNRQAAPIQAPVVPQFTEASLQAANAGYEAPTNVPLSQFYGAQQTLGRELEKTGELQRRLRESGGGSGMTNEALMAWAQKNPGLAYRELVNRESRAGIRPTAD
jgi:hypothetical protein